MRICHICKLEKENNPDKPDTFIGACGKDQEFHCFPCHNLWHVYAFGRLIEKGEGQERGLYS